MEFTLVAIFFELDNNEIQFGLHGQQTLIGPLLTLGNDPAIPLLVFR